MMGSAPDSNATPNSRVEPSVSTPARRFHRARWLIALIIVLLVATGAGLTYHYYGNPFARSCVSSPVSGRTLPCDFPRLSDATLKSFDTISPVAGETDYVWDLTAPESLQQLARFYANGFSKDGWPCVGGTVVGDLLAVAATNKADRPNTVAFMAFQINVPMSPNEYNVVLVRYADGHSPLPRSFKCADPSEVA